MSDFLTRLAERQLGRIETIEPRIKPLYAPMAHESQIPTIVEQSTSPPPLREEKTGIIEKSQLRVPKVEPTRSVEVANTNVRRAQPSVFEALPVSDQYMKQFSGAPLTTDSEGVQRPNKETRDVSPIAPKLAPVLPPADLQLFDRRQPKSRDASSGIKPLVMPSGKAEPVAPSSLVNTTKDFLTEREVMLTAPVSFSTRKDRVDNLTRPAADAPVRVTIGRIEVTAVTQTAPPKRVAPTRRPSLSLDDYLARRHGRER